MSMFPYFMILGRIIPAYGLCMVVAIFLTVSLSIVRGKKYNIKWEDILLVAVVAVGFAILGGGLLYILVTYPLEQLIQFISAGDFSFLVSGGIVFYGGLIGGVLGAFIGARIANIKLYNLDNIVVPFLPLGHTIGRIGCLLAGCCYGIEHRGFFSVYYKNSISGLPSNVGYFPVQILEASLNVFIAVALLIYANRKRHKYNVLFLYILLYSLVRLITEFYRGDIVRGIHYGLSTGQWISIFLIGLCLLRLVVVKLLTSRK